MLTQMTNLKGYNVGKTDEGKFVVILNNIRSPFLSFGRYKDCLDKVVALNAGYSDKVQPKFKKLHRTNARGKSVAAGPCRTLIG